MRAEKTLLIPVRTPPHLFCRPFWWANASLEFFICPGGTGGVGVLFFYSVTVFLLPSAVVPLTSQHQDLFSLGATKHRPVDFDMSLTKSPSPVCNRHLRNGLLTQVSNRNNIIIDLRLSNWYLYFFTSLSRIQAIQNRFNISIKMTYRNRQLSCNCVGCISKFVFDRANIKFNKRNNNPIIVLEIIELLLLLGIHYHDPDPYTVGKVSIDNIFSISNTRQRDVLALSTWGWR